MQIIDFASKPTRASLKSVWRQRAKIRTGVSKRRRRGASLVETLVIITLVAAAMSAVAVTIHTTLRLERRFRGQTAHDAALACLSTQFRSDAHLADQAQISKAKAGVPASGSPGSRLILSLPEQVEVVYEADGPRVVRIDSKDEQARHRDTFFLGEEFIARCRLETTESGDKAAIVIDRQPREPLQPRRRWLQIEAAVGLNLYGT